MQPFQTGEKLQELLAALAYCVQGYDAGSLVETLDFGKRGSWGSISARTTRGTWVGQAWDTLHRLLLPIILAS